MLSFSKLTEGRTIEIFDGTKALTEGVRDSHAQRVTLYAQNIPDNVQGVSVHPYRALLEASDCTAHVCMLNNRAIKVLVAMYPSMPKRVLVRLRPSFAWFLAGIGLLRRMVFGYVRIEGVTMVRDSANKRTYWLVLAQSGGISSTIPILPAKIGVQGFLDWLREKNITYVVLRFYEQLPKLNRVGGDLDILVADNDRPKVLRYIKEHEAFLSEVNDDIPIGLHSVSGEPGSIPYYPPMRSKQLLQNAVDGPAGSRIPSPHDALCAFIYHALYHSKKGYAAGIPSSLTEHPDTHPENNYVHTIKRMAEEQGLHLEITMEALDEYMAEVGWRPKLDTLAKIAETNAWVRDRFFSNTQHDIVGLSVFVLREWMLDRIELDAVVAQIEARGYSVIRAKKVSSAEQEKIATSLRGGTWGTNADGTTTGWLPGAVFVVVDLKCVRMPPAYALGFERFRVRKLKEDMRAIFDSDGFSSMHSTDNTHESWEYIEVCFPDEVEHIRDEAKSHMRRSLFATWIHLLKPAYIKHSLKHSLRSFLIRHFLE